MGAIGHPDESMWRMKILTLRTTNHLINSLLDHGLAGLSMFSYPILETGYYTNIEDFNEELLIYWRVENELSFAYCSYLESIRYY